MTPSRKSACPTGKRQFRTSIEVMVGNSRNPNKIRAYRCPLCGSWHGARKAKVKL